jgi:pilus assembly protein CpaB
MERLTPRQLLLLCGVIALLIFLLIYFTLTRMTAEKPKPEPVPAPKQVQVKDVTVVTAKTSIPERTLIKEEMLSLITMASNKVPNGALTRTTDLVGRPTRVAVNAGEIITTQKVFSSILDMGLSGRIPPDCRAITVGISDVTGVAGFAQPGDYVDVMLVSSQVENNKVVSEMILQNVLLLAINKQVENQGSASSQSNAKGQSQNAGNQPKVTGSPAMATMALVPEDALKLAAKAQMGQIYLVLRPYRPSNGVSDDTYYSVTKASGKMPVTPPPAGTIPPGADIDTSPTANVQVIRGTTTTVGR